MRHIRWWHVILLFGIVMISYSRSSSFVVGQSKIDALADEAMRFEQEQTTKPGAMSVDLAGNPVLVGEVAATVEAKYDQITKEIDAIHARPQKVREAAIASILNFLDTPNLVPEYQFTVPSTDGTNHTTEIYDVNTELGTIRYEVDATTNSVILFGGTGEGWSPPTEYKYAVEELEKQAIDFLSEKNSCFAKTITILQMDKSSKGTPDKPPYIWFFRWMGPDNSSGERAFTQVGIGVDGIVLSYVDTGICNLPTMSSQTNGYLPLISR